MFVYRALRDRFPKRCQEIRTSATERLYCLRLVEETRLILAHLTVLYPIEFEDVCQILSRSKLCDNKKQSGYKAGQPREISQQGSDGHCDDKCECSQAEYFKQNKTSEKHQWQVVFAFIGMVFISATSIVTIVIVDQKDSFLKSCSHAADYITIALLTAIGFIIQWILWSRRFRIKCIIRNLLQNIIELPNVYCLPPDHHTRDTMMNISSIQLESQRQQQFGSEKPISKRINDQYSIQTFVLDRVKLRHWDTINMIHFHMIILLVGYCFYCFYHLTLGYYLTIQLVGPSTLLVAVVTVGYFLQAITFFVYPVVNYCYSSLLLVHIVQVEHLNQYLRNIKQRTKYRLPLKEELDLVRVWYSRVIRSVLEYDRFSHMIFFLLYAGQIGGMMLNSLQVRIMFENSVFGVYGFINIVELLLYTFNTIYLMRIVHFLNKSLSKPNMYLSELGAHYRLTEPFEYSQYLHILQQRIHTEHYQVTFLRITGIGKKFFLITSLIILSATASIGNFSFVMEAIMENLHLII